MRQNEVAFRKHRQFGGLALYAAHRFDELPGERQQVLLHTLEAFLEDVDVKKEVKRIRENPAPFAAFVNMADLLPERVNQCANWYLSQGRFATADDIDPKDDEEVYPGIKFGQLDMVFRIRLVALLRHKMRQLFSPDLVAMEVAKDSFLHLVKSGWMWSLDVPVFCWRT